VSLILSCNDKKSNNDNLIYGILFGGTSISGTNTIVKKTPMIIPHFDQGTLTVADNRSFIQKFHGFSTEAIADSVPYNVIQLNSEGEATWNKFMSASTLPMFRGFDLVGSYGSGDQTVPTTWYGKNIRYTITPEYKTVAEDTIVEELVNTCTTDSEGVETCVTNTVQNTVTIETQVLIGATFEGTIVETNPVTLEEKTIGDFNLHISENTWSYTKHLIVTFGIFKDGSLDTTLGDHRLGNYIIYTSCSGTMIPKDDGVNVTIDGTGISTVLYSTLNSSWQIDFHKGTEDQCQARVYSYDIRSKENYFGIRNNVNYSWKQIDLRDVVPPTDGVKYPYVDGLSGSGTYTADVKTLVETTFVNYDASVVPDTYSSMWYTTFWAPDGVSNFFMGYDFTDNKWKFLMDTNPADLAPINEIWK